ncbi:hypothetical protein SCLAR_v1c01340 [Spiroplasma clarkii]|uniref:Uncharacterized protein n=3 Tax=Spiroplasma clarkii TaxID=2139 RepID=A0A2K8KFK3_9MOLU|nr:hypothetical protein SCLAR_v1c01340 [Spiroplasma clarkii]
MELPKIEVEGQPGEYYTKDQIKVLDSSGDAFYDVIKGKSSEYLRKEFEKHWTDIFNWLIDNYYSKNRELPDYEANAKILKGEFGKGNLFLWNTATWDMSGAAKEFKPHGSLTDGNGNVELKYGQAIKWNQENESNPLMMIGGLGTYQLAKHKEISMAFLQYLARKESSYTWMKNSRGMMFDSSSFETIETELDAIVNDESLTEDQKNQKLKEFFDPIDVDKPYIDTEYVEYWVSGMKQAIINAEQGTIIPSYPAWTSFLGEFSSAISALYAATKTNKLDDFKATNVKSYVERWVKALDPKSSSGWNDEYQ